MNEFSGYTTWHHVPIKVETDHDYNADIRIVTYTFRCSICGSIVEQPWYGSAVALPAHAGKGWIEYRPGFWICPKHKVVITVDGKELE